MTRAGRRFDPESNRLLGAWCLLLFFFLAVTLPNLTLWPTLFQDEMQIIDYGRVFLDPNTDWSMGWLVQESAPMTSMAYVGMTLQEVAYLLGSPSHFGSRYSSLCGAILASTLLLGWLRSRDTPAVVALLLALAFLLNPIFNESYRQGRVDSWALACFLAALWLMHDGLKASSVSKTASLRLVVAGGLAGLSIFVWPTTISLIPLMLIELLVCCWTITRTGVQSLHHHLYRAALPLALGGFLALVVLMVPILLELEAYQRSLEYSIRVQKFAASIQRPILDLYNVYDPWVIPLAVLSMLLPRNYAYNLAIVVALIMMYQTMVYPMRVLYLLPYLLAIMAGALTWVSETTDAPRRKTVFILATVLMVGGNVWVSLWQRPQLAESQAIARSPAQFDQRLEEAIGAGQHRVLTTEWEIYYAARALGWKTYYLFGRKDKTDEDFAEFISSMDFAIIRSEFAFFKPVNEDDLLQNGFQEYRVITFESLPGQADEGIYKPMQVFKNLSRDAKASSLSNPHP